MNAGSKKVVVVKLAERLINKNIPSPLTVKKTSLSNNSSRVAQGAVLLHRQAIKTSSPTRK
jgi:hypothetical protein